MSGIFITGTDTGIGKTLVSTAVLSILRDAGIHALPMKPVHSGCSLRRGKLIPDDVEFTLSALQLSLQEDTKDSVVPYLFTHACSPHLAAQLSNTSISVPHILSCARQLQTAADAIVVEGAGGLMVPITTTCMVVDLIAKMKLPALLVARPVLGTLNHTLLSLQCMRDHGIKVLGVVMNATTPASKRTDFIEKDNIRIIRKLGNIPVFGPLPYIPQLKDHPNRWALYEKQLTTLMPTAGQLMRWMKRP